MADVQRKMIISLGEPVYQGFLSVVGKRKMSEYISE
jgi:hypothetical protein